MATAVLRSACNDEVDEMAVVVMDSAASADKQKGSGFRAQGSRLISFPKPAARSPNPKPLPSLPHTGVGLVLEGDATYDGLEVSAVRMQGVEHGS